ncbi:unnamed protein product [Leptidea sinapis]|uniref:Uncharacterized protein n=1 Tax=Leptidea sinapis TaxID=189913 RepID=A0A5E4QHX5_9NEOP|nr:unnamed protein product [Leptidea sinapis]
MLRVCMVVQLCCHSRSSHDNLDILEDGHLGQSCYHIVGEQCRVVDHGEVRAGYGCGSGAGAGVVVARPGPVGSPAGISERLRAGEALAGSPLTIHLRLPGEQRRGVREVRRLSCTAQTLRRECENGGQLSVYFRKTSDNK